MTHSPCGIAEVVPTWKIHVLTLGIDGDWLVQSELQLRLRPQMDVLLPGEERHGCPSARANWATYKGALTAGSRCSDQRASTGTASNPRPIPFLVVSAPAVRTRRFQII